MKDTGKSQRPFPSFALALAMSLGWAAWSTPSFGQASETQPVTSPGISPPPPGEAQPDNVPADSELGIPLGSFRLFPTLDVRAGYDTNVFASSAGQQTGSAYEAIRPSLDVRSDWNNHMLNFGGYGAFGFFNSAATQGLEAARVIREELPGTAIIVLSAHVEVDEAMDLLAGGERLGYLLKSRITDVAEFIDTVSRITAGASVVDPSLVQELVQARRRRDPLDDLSPREREVLALMAEGASNAGIAHQIFVSEGTVEKHVRSILTKLDLAESVTEHRRVLAVLRFLEAR